MRRLLLVCGILSTVMLQGCDYSCRTADGLNHCYGSVTWKDRPFRSISFIMQPVPLQGGDGFVDDEVWLIDENNPACPNFSNMCWVEAGIVADAHRGFATDTHYFWADNRPGKGFLWHDLGSVPSYDLTHNALFLIESLADYNDPTLPNMYGIGVGNNGIYEYSTDNTMISNRIDLGQELDGTTGASAPPAVFWGLGFFLFGDVLNPGSFDVDGQVKSQSPPTGKWMQPPSKAGSLAKFVTNCCG